ncbi:hypothetical protein [Nocardia sp. NPDC051570]|uniref:hypothetical protein n=1 Tax=Nocardia sp. NPDC051570 TaxID=3364324 RepID=UPI0037929BFE
MTEVETVDLHVIARIESDCAVADLYVSDPCYDAVDGHPAGRILEGWGESVVTDPGAPVTLDALDAALTADGYTRVSGWRERVTAAGAVRWFAEAVIRVEAIDR